MNHFQRSATATAKPEIDVNDDARVPEIATRFDQSLTGETATEESAASGEGGSGG